MFKLLVVFAHLLGTCMALGMIVLTDARIVAKVLGYKVVIPPPSRFETRVIAIALLLQVASGAVLVALGLAEDAQFLANPKLQAKMLLVALLCANAFVLHYLVFPGIERSAPVARWGSAQRNVVAASVALSNGLWLYVAFLGIAQPWNHTMSLAAVLAIAAGVWLVMLAVIRFVLTLVGRDEVGAGGDWIDAVKTTLSGLSDLGEYKPRYEQRRAAPRRAPPRPARTQAGAPTSRFDG